MKLLRAWLMLFWLSFTRLLWSANTLMVAPPLVGAALFVWRRGYDRVERFAEPFGPFGGRGGEGALERAFNAFSQELVLIVFATFLLPIVALAYGTTSIGGDREDRTLLFLLVRPVPRWLILLGKLSATLPLVLGLVVGSFWGYCRLAGEPGQLAYERYAPAMVCMTLAYVGLFHLFAVSFRHSTIVALLYAMFLEFFIGNMPGIIKRVSVSFYGKSMIYESGADALGYGRGLPRPDPEWFVPVSAAASAQTLLGIAAAGTALALFVFSRREYRDLS